MGYKYTVATFDDRVEKKAKTLESAREKAKRLSLSETDAYIYQNGNQLLEQWQFGKKI